MLLGGRNTAAFAIILPPAQAAMQQNSDRNAAELNQKPGLKSWPISVIAAIQMRQRMRVSSSFFERKKSENAPFILKFSPLFVTAERQDGGELRS